MRAKNCLIIDLSNEVKLKEKEVKVKRTLIGGQALMEGATSMAMAVRTENGDILTETKRLKGKRWYSHVPIVRGVVAFVKSLIGGTSVLLKSAEVIYPEEETPSKGSFAIATALGLVLAIALFMLLPSFLADMTEKLFALHRRNGDGMTLEDVRQQSAVIHYCGRNKPWKPGYMGELNVFYNEAVSQMSENGHH